MSIAQPNDLNPSESGSNVMHRPTEIIVDAISLTINGIRFFRCPTEQEMSQAVRSSSRPGESIGHVWDSVGVCLFTVAEHNVVEFTIDHVAQAQHGCQGNTSQDFRGSISIFNYTLPNNPILSQIKTNLECIPKHLGFKHVVDFEKLAVADVDPDHAGPLNVEIYVGRFPPKPLLSVTVTFFDNPFERRKFNLKADEGIIATHGLHSDQFWFAITNKRLIALKRDKDSETSPVGNWSLSEIRGFHIIPRSVNWWQADHYCQRFTIELRHSTVQLRGFFTLLASVALRYDRGDADRSERFFRSLRMAQFHVTQGPSDISCTRPPISQDERALGSASVSPAPELAISTPSVVPKTVSCPCCNFQISPNAVSCPSCGEPIRETVAEEPFSRHETALAPKHIKVTTQSTSKTIKLAMVVFGLGFWVALVSIFVVSAQLRPLAILVTCLCPIGFFITKGLKWWFHG